MRIGVLAVLPALLGALSPAGARGPAIETEWTSARAVSRIHAINRLEMEAGRLAARKGQSQEIRSYGDLLFRDHRAGDRKVLSLAENERLQLVTLPSEAKDRATLRRLERADAGSFDREFLKVMRAGHHEAVALLAEIRDKTADRALESLAARLLPILRQHEELAEHLEG